VAATWVVGLALDVPCHAGWSAHTFDRKTQKCLWVAAGDAEARGYLPSCRNVFGTQPAMQRPAVTFPAAEVSSGRSWRCRGPRLPSQLQKCLWDRTLSHHYTLFYVTVGMLLPFVIIVLCYCLSVRLSVCHVHTYILTN